MHANYMNISTIIIMCVYKSVHRYTYTYTKIYLKNIFGQSAGAVECTDYISAEG